jgi:hypothetical protein
METVEKTGGKGNRGLTGEQEPRNQGLMEKLEHKV